ncbi:MAG: hypothetical protein IJY58_02780 [Alphaproteobacteria bacterium]|nr:hypothetical protein [Alphaproteobacteria bacterium]
MKLNLWITVMLCCSTMTAQAHVLTAMQDLPEKIIVDENDTTLNFQKGIRPDSFYIEKDKELGTTYRQTYSNAVCHASVTHLPAHIGRMSNIKVQKYIKENTHFQITRQDSEKIGDIRFYMNVGATPDQTTVMMIGGYDNSLIKIHNSCQMLPDMTFKANEKTAIYWTKMIVKKILPLIKKIPQNSAK